MLAHPVLSARDELSVREASYLARIEAGYGNLNGLLACWKERQERAGIRLPEALRGHAFLWNERVFNGFLRSMIDRARRHGGLENFGISGPSVKFEEGDWRKLAIDSVFYLAVVDLALGEVRASELARPLLRRMFATVYRIRETLPRPGLGPSERSRFYGAVLLRSLTAVRGMISS